VSKFTLAFAAVILLPVLESYGFQAGEGDQAQSGLWMLTVLYALVPSLLKLVAIAILAATKLED
jgi:GPH family glycoside/pentoside/hexuronide:cation symporter